MSLDQCHGSWLPLLSTCPLFSGLYENQAPSTGCFWTLLCSACLHRSLGESGLPPTPFLFLVPFTFLHTDCASAALNHMPQLDSKCSVRTVSCWAVRTQRTHCFGWNPSCAVTISEISGPGTGHSGPDVLYIVQIKAPTSWGCCQHQMS